MGIDKISKLSVLPIILATTQVNSASISYYLDQSNALTDGINYAQVTISDSTTVAGDIDFSIEVLSSEFTVSGSNFGVQSFSFNYDTSLVVGASNIVDLDPGSWRSSQDKSAGGGFGKFEFKLSGNGSSRTELLNFSITGVTGDSILSYAMVSNQNPASTEFFAAHIAGFDITNGETSAQFAGSSPVVPIPATAWLFASGLIALTGLIRRKQPV